MKYLSSFRTTLKVSRYLFRSLAAVLWLLGALLSTFYIIDVLRTKESDIRQEYNLNFDRAQGYIRHSAEIVREIEYVAENRLKDGNRAEEGKIAVNSAMPEFYPLYSDGNCQAYSATYRHSLASMNGFIHYWVDNFASAYDLNRVFFIGGESLCMADFGVRNVPMDRESVHKILRDRIAKHRNIKRDDKNSLLFWLIPGPQPDSGYLYVIAPIHVGSRQVAFLGIEQTIRMEDFVMPSSLPIGGMLLDESNTPVLQLLSGERSSSALTRFPQSTNYYGYADGYSDLILKKALPPSELSIVYSLPVKTVLERFRMLFLNTVLLNILSAALLFTLAWLFERKMLSPAEDNAFRLEEHEQFNRKIVASAPVGISILRVSDGANILSNELAHNYISLLTHEDRQRIIRIICERQSNFVDVHTSNSNNLQISFVHSRYRNEDVAICVLVDVSSRVKMEESLQEMAAAAEQASQSKSMFLATVSHELRTPLYGIIGNLELLQNKTLPEGAERLVSAMSNSSSLLLKIISDILDFSKIESEQLKIEPRLFSPREVIAHIVNNSLPLVVKKRLGLYCFIEPEVPAMLSGDPVRLQQVISNLLNNAIKFTDTGCIILQVRVSDGYLEFSVRDTGVGIPLRELVRLFDPFFQVGSGVQRHFQGTGLGLAICEKLIGLMDGDIAVESEPGLGSLFTIRLPLYGAQYAQPVQLRALEGCRCWLDIRNARLERYISTQLALQGMRSERYSGHETAADEVLICDYPCRMTTPLRAQVEFSISHMGQPQEFRPGYWFYSTAAPQELVNLLLRLYQGECMEPPCPTALPEPSSNRYENDDICLLVVDDHPLNRLLLADQLFSLGYQVLTANDGVDALGVLNSSEVDILLTDVNMPNMDGYLLTQNLRQSGATLPVIGVTANALAEERQRCLNAGMDHCLSKPVTLEVLQQTLAHYGELIRQTRADKET